jgi:carboxyl-terminal processing protease
VDDLLLAYHDGHLTTRGYARTFAGTYRAPLARRTPAPRPTPVLVGVGLEFRFVAGAVVITRVRPGSPAARAGLRPGDVVRMAGDVAALSRLGSSLRWRGWARLEAGIQFAADRLMIARPWYPDTPLPRERLVIARGGEIRTLTLEGAREPEVEERDLALGPTRCGGAILRVGGFSGAPQRIRRRLDAHLAAARSARFLVVDLRGNRGGQPGLAMHLVQRLIATRVIAGHHRYLRSPVLAEKVPVIRSLAADPADPRWTVWVPDPVEPAADALRVPVAVLVDEVCASACEIAAKALRAAPTATLYGEATAGSSGLPVDVPLPRSRLLVSLPTWQTRTADGTLIEGNGVAPHVRVPLTLGDLQADRDAPLDRALEDRCRAALPAGSENPHR